MAKLTIVGLDNSSQFFGTTEYAMFQATTESNDIIVLGLSHNLLDNKKIDEMDFDNLVDTVVTTKKSIDQTTGLVNDPDETLEKVLNGEYQVMLLGRPTVASLQTSELYKLEKRELQSSIGAKMRIEKEKEAKRVKLERAKSNRLAKLLALKEAEALAKSQEKALEADDAFEEFDEPTPTEEPTTVASSTEEAPF